MKARRLIEQQQFLSPADLLVVTYAFEQAWEALEDSYSDEGREAARLRLASIIIDLARNGERDGDNLMLMAIDATRKPFH